MHTKTATHRTSTMRLRLLTSGSSLMMQQGISKADSFAGRDAYMLPNSEHRAKQKQVLNETETNYTRLISLPKIHKVTIKKKPNKTKQNKKKREQNKTHKTKQNIVTLLLRSMNRSFFIPCQPPYILKVRTCTTCFENLSLHEEVTLPISRGANPRLLRAPSAIDSN